MDSTNGNICYSALCLCGPDVRLERFALLYSRDSASHNPLSLPVQPALVTDDCEGAAVLKEVCASIDALPDDVREHVFLALLPMQNLGENAQMVNAIQTASFVIVQNSIEEGFGLTAVEALYKRVACVGTAQAVGLRAQIEDGVSGILTHGDPRVAVNVAQSLAHVLSNDAVRDFLAINGQLRAVERGLMYRQGEEWLDLVLALRSGKAQ